MYEKPLNKYEKENGKICYERLIFDNLDYVTDIQKNNIIMANKFVENNWQNIEFYNNIEEEVFQWFIITNGSYKRLQKYTENDVILAYDYENDINLLGVNHIGTSWDMVLTSINIKDYDYTIPTEISYEMEKEILKEIYDGYYPISELIEYINIEKIYEDNIRRY